MNTRLPITLLALATFALTPACKKDQTTENPDQVAAEGGGEEGGEQEAAGLPAQDPDPAELAALYQRYLAGDYEAVASEAESLRATYTEPSQVRAHGIASAIAALAAIESIAENGQGPAEEAVRDADQLGDPEVAQIAHVAHGWYLVRVHEAETGQAEIEAVLEGPYQGLARVALAEAHLNQAYGINEDGEESVLEPSKFDDARMQYEAALNDSSPLIQAQAHEGLAAVAKYKGEKDQICVHAQEAENLYAANGASSNVREVPSLLAGGARCKDFKKAE